MKRSLGLVLVVAMAALFATPIAASATYSLACPPGDASCAALAERLEAQVAATEANGTKLDANGAKLDAITTALEGDGSPSEVSGTVALSTDDRDRLDLTSWGIWFAAGVLLCLLFSQLWHRVWRFWQ